MFDVLAILHALRDRWVEYSDLTTYIGAPYLAGAEQKAEGGTFASIILVGGATDWTLTPGGPVALEMLSFDFALYDDSADVATIGAITKACTACFDNHRLNFGDSTLRYNPILCDRTGIIGPEREDRIWRVLVSYQLLLQEGP